MDSSHVLPLVRRFRRSRFRVVERIILPPVLLYIRLMLPAVSLLILYTHLQSTILCLGEGIGTTVHTSYPALI